MPTFQVMIGNQGVEDFEAPNKAAAYKKAVQKHCKEGDVNFMKMTEGVITKEILPTFKSFEFELVGEVAATLVYLYIGAKDKDIQGRVYNEPDGSFNDAGEDMIDKFLSKFTTLDAALEGFFPQKNPTKQITRFKKNLFTMLRSAVFYLRFLNEPQVLFCKKEEVVEGVVQMLVAEDGGGAMEEGGGSIWALQSNTERLKEINNSILPILTYDRKKIAADEVYKEKFLNFYQPMAYQAGFTKSEEAKKRYDTIEKSRGKELPKAEGKERQAEEPKTQGEGLSQEKLADEIYDMLSTYTDSELRRIGDLAFQYLNEVHNSDVLSESIFAYLKIPEEDREDFRAYPSGTVGTDESPLYEYNKFLEGRILRYAGETAVLGGIVSEEGDEVDFKDPEDVEVEFLEHLIDLNRISFTLGKLYQDKEFDEKQLTQLKKLNSEKFEKVNNLEDRVFELETELVEAINETTEEVEVQEEPKSDFADVSKLLQEIADLTEAREKERGEIAKVKKLEIQIQKLNRMLDNAIDEREEFALTARELEVQLEEARETQGPTEAETGDLEEDYDILESIVGSLDVNVRKLLAAVKNYDDLDDFFESREYINIVLNPALGEIQTKEGVGEDEETTDEDDD